MAFHNDLGAKGEQIAADFLIGKGYTILAKNYRYRKAELDIIAQKESILAIVEVKTRTEAFWESMEQTIGKRKIQLLTTAADFYVQEKDLEVDVRFDVILVIFQGKEVNIEHWEDAFYHF
ncbi:MAG: YraN family protein [Bacteroidota bacterium]